MGKLSSSIKGLLALQFAPLSLQACAFGKPTPAPLHYRPLNGDNLRELAKRKAHHGQDVFLNPMGLPRNGRFFQVLSWKLFHKNHYGDFIDDQQVSPVTVDWDRVRGHRGVSITFLKHSTLLIKDLDRFLIIDPVFDDLFWFIKDFNPLNFKLDGMPRPDHVLITHGHYDHLDKSSLGKLDPKTHVVSPLGYDDVFKSLGMGNRTQLDWYQSHWDGDREITLVPANHWSMRNPFSGPNRSLWGGYLIKTAGWPVIYISGDSAYFDGYEQLAADFNIDLAIFNLGAYAPRRFMAPSHMDPSESVQAFEEIKAKRLMIAHWGTYRLGDEPVHFPPQDLKQALNEKGLLSHWIDLDHGETHFF